MFSDGLAIRYDHNLCGVGEYPFGGDALAKCLDELSEGLLLGMIQIHKTHDNIIINVKFFLSAFTANFLGNKGRAHACN